MAFSVGQRSTMWGRRRQISTLLSLLGVLPATQSFSSVSRVRPFQHCCGPASIAPYNRDICHTPLRFRRNSLNQLRLRLASSIVEKENKTSWDEPDFEDDEENNEDDNSASAPLMEEYRRWSRCLKSTIKALEKKRKSLQSEYEKAQGVEDTVARAQLLVSNLYLFTPGVTTAKVQDWENGGVEVELALDPKYDSANAEADALFAQARKLKRGSQIVRELLEETAEGLELLQEAQTDLETACMEDGEVDQGRLALVQDRLKRSSRTTNFQVPSPPEQESQSRSSKSSRRPSKPEIGSPQSNIRKLMSPGGCVVLVGRNKRGNEYLSLTIARSNDIWMHSRGCPGAHVLIQNRRGSPPPTAECVQFAANLAIFYSDFRNEKKAPVTAAEPKHLQKPRGAPLGAIKVRQEWKTFIGFPEQVPDELKIAREESGQSDEYRSTDKAKHRRRTKQVTQEERAKRKKPSERRKPQLKLRNFTKIDCINNR
eukprot:scaffold3719_cov104-Cylindrotheca_fusiformis.AAC.1